MRFFNEPAENEQNPKYPCGICNKNVSSRFKALKCQNCGYWNHIRCDGIPVNMYDKLAKLPESEKKKIIHYCKFCLEDNLPFQKISDQEFITSIIKNINYNEDLNLRIRPPDGIQKLFTDFSNHNEDEPAPINCEYYDATSRIPNSKNPNFTMIHLNIASLGRHKEELVAALSHVTIDFDIIAVSESRIIKNREPIYDISIPGYQPFSTPTETSKGGVMIYVKDNIDVKRRPDLEAKMYESGQLESVFIEILNGKRKNEIFGCIYRHPTMDIKSFNKNYFHDFISGLTAENRICYLAGDFNVDLLRTDNDDEVRKFFETLTANLFVPHITLPTRMTTRSQTLIDNIFSNNPEFNNCTSGNFTFSISDHFAQFLIVPSSDKRPPKIHNIQKRDTRNYVHEDLVAEIISIDWPVVLESWKGDPCHSFQCFNDKVTGIIDRHMPLRKLNKKEIRLQAKPWLTRGILQSIKRRDKLLRKYIRASDPARKEELHVEYRALRNRIKYIIRQSKKTHYQNYFTENCKNIKNTWIGIKSIINIRSTSRGQPSSMLIDDNLKTNPIDIAEGFNAYFSTVAEKLLPKSTPGTKHFSEYLSQPLDHNFILRSADPVEVMSIITLLDTNKGTGPYSIPGTILKSLKANLCFPLTTIINMSFATGIYPDQLKIAQVIPIFKKGDKLLVSNYRPISLLSNINKIFEKLIYSRLYSFLEIHNCIYELQFGFRAKHSTQHALASLTEMVRQALDNENFTCGIFVDFAKAFDTVDHDILLKKLEHYGVRGLANDLFRSYLSNRKQYVTINGIDSSTRIMKYGVPQGSVLGPLLFLIYINDLHHAIKFCTTHHFADDTNFLYSSKSLKKIQKFINLDLRFLCNWLKANKISLNASKTEMLIFRDPNRKIDFDLKIKIDGKRVTPSKYVKYLGIYLDNFLSWHQQEQDMRSRLSRAAGMLCKVRNYVDFDTLKMVYSGIFSSILGYGSLIWGQHDRIVTRLQKIQNKAIRYMNFKSKRTSANPLFASSGILKLADHITLQNCLFAHDSLNRNLPYPLIDNRITLVNTGHNTLGERLNHLQIFQTRTVKYGSKSIKSKAVSSWNIINNELHHLKLQDKSKATCKAYVTKLLLGKYDPNNTNHRINLNPNHTHNHRHNNATYNPYGREFNALTGQFISRWDQPTGR